MATHSQTERPDTAWLLNIGQLLRVEHAAVEHPVSQRLAALLERLKAAEGSRPPVSGSSSRHFA